MGSSNNIKYIFKDGVRKQGFEVFANMKQEDDMKTSLKAVIGSIITVAILFIGFWVFMLQIQITDMKNDMEDWSQHIAEKVADAENKANLKYEADMETLEKLFDLIYKLKQMEEQNAE